MHLILLMVINTSTRLVPLINTISNLGMTEGRNSEEVVTNHFSEMIMLFWGSAKVPESRKSMPPEATTLSSIWSSFSKSWREPTSLRISEWKNSFLKNGVLNGPNNQIGAIQKGLSEYRIVSGIGKSRGLQWVL